MRLGEGDLAGAERALRAAIRAEPARFEPWQQRREVTCWPASPRRPAAAERQPDRLNPFWDGR